jgi:acyl carrier protein
MRELEQELRRFIVEELVEERFHGSDPLASDAVDSLGLEQLVAYIEERFGVVVADEEMVAENFESVTALATLVDSKREVAEA